MEKKGNPWLVIVIGIFFVVLAIALLFQIEPGIPVRILFTSRMSMFTQTQSFVAQIFCGVVILFFGAGTIKAARDLFRSRRR